MLYKMSSILGLPNDLFARILFQSESITVYIGSLLAVGRPMLFILSSNKQQQVILSELSVSPMLFSAICQ
jgi:hypothetical protein